MLGATGKLGKLVADRLANQPDIKLRVTSKDPAELDGLKQRYGDAVFLELDDARTFKSALEGVNSLFLLTGYTMNMVSQSKTILDAAKIAGVEHIVHLGGFTRQWNCTDPHKVWHQIVEMYIKHMQFKWTMLHPNCFMQNLISFSLVKKGKVRWFMEDKPCGWVALEDIAMAAAKVLQEGPITHDGKDYWFSTEAITLSEIAKILSDVTGFMCEADPQPPHHFLEALPPPIDPYLYSVVEMFTQVNDGRIGYIADVHDDLPVIVGRKGITMRQWAEQQKVALSDVLK